jgi:chorismate synthase
MFNEFGKFIKLTTFGESHGLALGGIIDGFPAGLSVNFDEIQKELNRRKPGQSKIVTQRKEDDKVEFLSGIFEGKTTGQSIGFIIKNINQKSHDYDHNTRIFRPSHADFTYFQKYGIRDYRGGGRTSARETANWVVVGALAKQLMSSIRIHAFVSSVGEITLQKNIRELDFNLTESNTVRCPDIETAEKMIQKIAEIKKEGDTIGGIITCIIKNVPIGLGEPIFDKLSARLAQGMMSINAAKGFEIGSGFAGTQLKGSEHNDIFIQGGKTLTNNSGGIQGGISNGMDIIFKVAFKPVATIMKEQQTIDERGNISAIKGKGRHDPCVLPRAVPIVEAIAAFILADFYLMNKARKI